MMSELFNVLHDEGTEDGYEETKEIMGRKLRISLHDRGKVLASSKGSYTQCEIGARVGCSQDSVSAVLERKRLTGSVKDAEIPGRRGDIKNRREGRIIVRKSMSNSSKT